MHITSMMQNVQDIQHKVDHAEHLKRITAQILAASHLDHILLDLHKDILSVFDAQDLTLFAFDSEKKEIFSKVPHIDGAEEVRIPITEQSLAGFCAKYLRPVNITDAYNLAELRAIHPALLHDTSYDKRTGFKTKQVLTYPVVADNKYLMGSSNCSTRRAGAGLHEKTKKPSTRSPRLWASPFSTSKKHPKKLLQSSTSWSAATVSRRTSWSRRSSMLARA
jgi:hypothetical protein